MSSLGIYFGPKLIKIVETKGRKIKIISEIRQSTISAGELEEKVPSDVKTIEFVALFKDELRRHKIQAKEATLALSGRDLIIRTFEIPMIPREEIESAVNFEAKKYIPFKVEELIADFQLKFDKASRTYLVLFMGLKKETMDRYLAISNQLGIKIHNIEYAAFSMLRCLRLSNLSDKGIIGILAADVTGEDEVNFTVLENGFPLFSRDISLAGGPQHPGPTKDAGTSEALDKLKTEIHVSLDYYNRKFPSKNIKKVFLICHPDSRSDLEASIKETNFSVQFVNTAKYSEKSIPYSLCFLKAYAASLAKTVRLQLKVNLLAAKEKLKLLKEKGLSKERGAIFEDLRLDYRILLLGILLCVGAYVYGIYQIRPLSRELNDILTQRVTVKDVNPNISEQELTDIATKEKEKLESLESLIKGQVYLTEIFNVLPRDLPEGLFFTSLLLNKKEETKVKLVLDGRIFLGDSEREFGAVNDLLSHLQNSPEFTKYFRQIDLASINQEKPLNSPTPYTGFSITCKNYLTGD